MFRYYFTKILRVKSILNGSPVLFFLFVQFAAVNGQYSTPLDTLINFKTATVDPLGCIFYATGSNEIVKLGLDGKRSAFYSNNSLGNVKTIDVTNPFKILVFYPEFYTIVFLDRQLVEINRQNLMDRGFGEILLAGHSRDGHIWLFDELDHKLKKMNLQGNTIAESGDLRLTLGKQIIPVRIREHSDKSPRTMRYSLSIFLPTTCPVNIIRMLWAFKFQETISSCLKILKWRFQI